MINVILFFDLNVCFDFRSMAVAMICFDAVVVVVVVVVAIVVVAIVDEYVDPAAIVVI